MPWLDVTLPLDESTPPFPGDPGLVVQKLMAYERGENCCLSAIALSAHLGTHVDAPLHFVPNGASIEQIPLETLIGSAHVVEIITRHGIPAEQLRRLLPESCARLLIKTSTRDALLSRPTAWLTASAAKLLVEKKMKLVGIDSPSVDAMNATQAEAHHILLQHGGLIIENLALSNITAGEYEMICLPLKLVGLEGAPARVVLKKKE
ncbi:MAG: cyclase family protein [candidate division KSB1 bacterium]